MKRNAMFADRSSTLPGGPGPETLSQRRRAAVLLRFGSELWKMRRPGC